MKKHSVETNTKVDLDFILKIIIVKYRNIKVIGYQKAAFIGRYILSSLTKKQQEILRTSKKNGYYDYARAIDGYKLSEKMGIRKATAIE